MYITETLETSARIAVVRWIEVKNMRIQTLDRIDIFCLPDNAVCYASDGCVSPEKLMDCPTGCEVCLPDVCANYGEEDMRGEHENE